MLGRLAPGGVRAGASGGRATWPREAAGSRAARKLGPDSCGGCRAVTRAPAAADPKPGGACRAGAEPRRDPDAAAAPPPPAEPEVEPELGSGGRSEARAEPGRTDPRWR